MKKKQTELSELYRLWLEEAERKGCCLMDNMGGWEPGWYRGEGIEGLDGGMRDEGMGDEGWKDEGRGMKAEGWRDGAEGWRDEGWGMKGWGRGMRD